MTRALFAVVCATAALCGCSMRDVIELNTENQPALAATDDYHVAQLKINFAPPQAWAISDDDWALWLEQWQTDFREELRTECFKSLHFPEESGLPKGATVSCSIYELSIGGAADFSDSGFARAHVVVKDAQGKLIYDAKIEATGGHSGFESKIAQGRIKLAIRDIARQVAEVLERG